MFVHLLLVLLMTMRLSTSFMVMMEMRPPAFLQKLRLPRAQTWEFVWLVTLLPMIFGYVAVRKNRVFLLQQYLIGNFVFGILPALFGLYFHFDDLMEYWETKSAALLFRGFPVIVLWYMFLVIVLQLHSFEIYFSYQLLRAWNPDLKKKKNWESCLAFFVHFHHGVPISGCVVFIIERCACQTWRVFHDDINVEPVSCFNIKMSHQYRNSHHKDKTVLRPTYLYNGNLYTGKTSLYWNSPQSFS